MTAGWPSWGFCWCVRSLDPILSERSVQSVRKEQYAHVFGGVRAPARGTRRLSSSKDPRDGSDYVLVIGSVVVATGHQDHRRRHQPVYLNMADAGPFIGRFPWHANV